MSANTFAKAVAAALQASGIPYVLVGSFSSNLYGVPRSTKDADFVVELGNRQLTDILPILGNGYRLDP